MTASQVTYGVDRTVPIHEQALLDRLSEHEKQLMFIDRRIHFATSGPGNNEFPSVLKRHRTKCPRKFRKGRSLGVVVGSGVTKTRAVRKPRKPRKTERQPGIRTDRSRRKLPMQEVQSAFCDVYMILTHLVGIETTPNIDLRRQAEGLEDNAFQAVVRLTDLALLVDKGSPVSKISSEFEDLFKCVSMILLRNGPDSKTQEQRRKVLEKLMLKPGCDELAQTLETLSMKQEVSIKQEAVEY